jgi:hypothetical protein
MVVYKELQQLHQQQDGAGEGMSAVTSKGTWKSAVSRGAWEMLQKADRYGAMCTCGLGNVRSPLNNHTVAESRREIKAGLFLLRWPESAHKP